MDDNNANLARNARRRERYAHESEEQRLARNERVKARRHANMSDQQRRLNNERQRAYRESNRQEQNRRRQERYGNNRIALNERRRMLREANRELTTESLIPESNLRNRPNTTAMSGLISNFMAVSVEEHYCGAMDKECPYCHAMHFASEGKKSKLENQQVLTFLNCCHHGNVSNLIAVRALPAEFIELFQKKDFMDNIRSYNSSIAMASCGGQIEHMPAGPYVFRLHGQMYHSSGPLYPNQGEKPSYGQLYIYDSDQATQIRLQHPANSGCDESILSMLHYFMVNNNKLVECHRMLKEVENDMIASGKVPKNLMMAISTNNNFDRRRYNAARENEIAMVFNSDDGEPPFNRDIRVYLRNDPIKKVKGINILNEFLDALTYPLFFPFGDSGWKTGLLDKNGKKISEMQYFSFHLQMRQGERNHLLAGGKLTHQLMVDWYCRMEANRLNYLRYHQKQLKCESYSNLREYVSNEAAASNSTVGRTVICPSTFEGSPRNMQQKYQDAMAIVRKFGKPDLFITMTCNPNWNEIKENLYAGQFPQDRPDIVARVFTIKLKELIEDITKRDVFGKCVAFSYSIEFQKRGLPHAHILWFGSDIDLKDPKWVNEVVCSEIPPKDSQSTLFKVVAAHMLHGPCSSKCLKNGVCSKHFPKEFQEETNTMVDTFPLYKRRNTGIKIRKGNNEFTNQHVVPYNPYLLQKFNCHINVEVCSSVKAVKYIFKYVFKGHDCADLVINEKDGTVSIDEINQHVNARYVSAPEGMWRIFGFSMAKKSHTIYRLNIHEPEQQVIYYNEGDEDQALQRVKDSNLLAYFKLNADAIEGDNASQFLYADIPNHYTFGSGVWKKRKNGFDPKVIGRMYFVSPHNTERYAIKILLLNIRGAKSFDDLKTVDGFLCSTFQEACVKLNLCENDDQWYNAMNEALIYQMPRQLRQLFAIICSFGCPANAKEIYEQYKEHLIQDFIREHSEEVAEQLALHDIEDVLKLTGKSGKQFGLPQLRSYMRSNMFQSFDLETEKNLFHTNYDKLNCDQKLIVDDVITSINGNIDHNCIHLNGPGGSGKTFVYETLMSYVRGHLFNDAQGVVIAVASTGIAATLLKGGRTYHSQFGVPPNVDKDSTTTLSSRSFERDRIKNAQLIIWDECTMACKHSLEVVNRLLKEIMGNQKPFGGKIIILGGDFRQVLNVVKRGSRVSIVELNVKSSNHWKLFRKYELKVNMRAREDPIYSEWILKLGDGLLNMQVDERPDMVVIPDNLLTTNDLVNEIFSGITLENIEEYSNHAILCPLNDDVEKINLKILSLLPGDLKCYKSSDNIDSANDEDVRYYPVEYLNSITLPGMPPHALKLKVGSIVMLLRNLNTKRGLCNGTRLIVRELKENVILCTVLIGRAKGENVFVPRITLTSNEGEFPFVLKRRQFPIKLSFSMTINKSQGQSLNKVGIYLPKPCFTHGQIYVAFSRATLGSNVKVFVQNNSEQGELLGEGGGYFTRNCVFKEML